jgi:hypothetical protein
VKTHQEKIATCDEAREELLEDIEEIRYDISNTNDVINRNKNRIKLLDQFQINASLRRPEILKQLAGVTEEDKAAGTVNSKLFDDVLLWLIVDGAHAGYQLYYNKTPLYVSTHRKCIESNNPLLLSTFGMMDV